eukprot:123122-Pleurochrysis_carterae.AAC.1
MHTHARTCARKPRPREKRLPATQLHCYAYQTIAGIGDYVPIYLFACERRFRISYAHFPQTGSLLFARSTHLGAPASQIKLVFATSILVNLVLEAMPPACKAPRASTLQPSSSPPDFVSRRYCGWLAAATD